MKNFINSFIEHCKTCILEFKTKPFYVKVATIFNALIYIIVIFITLRLLVFWIMLIIKSIINNNWQDTVFLSGVLLTVFCLICTVLSIYRNL